MRKEFSATIEKLMSDDRRILFLTGDLGFMALENIQYKFADRFINAGVSEQNMITMAAALANDGHIPVCYSIAPFAVFRPAEQIRLDVCLHNMNVKIIGNGGGYGYGIMGATHHAIEDIAVLSSFQNMRCYIPYCNEEVGNVIGSMMSYNGPSYLRLGFGVKPEYLKDEIYKPVQKIMDGSDVTILGLGPVVMNAIAAVRKLNSLSADVYVISEIPVPESALSEDFYNSIRKTKKLIVIEEHVRRGGVMEFLAVEILKNRIDTQFVHLCAHGYVNGLYGSQKYHQSLNGLDEDSVVNVLKELL